MSLARPFTHLWTGRLAPVTPGDLPPETSGSETMVLTGSYSAQQPTGAFAASAIGASRVNRALQLVGDARFDAAAAPVAPAGVSLWRILGFYPSASRPSASLLFNDGVDGNPSTTSFYEAFLNPLSLGLTVRAGGTGFQRTISEAQLVSSGFALGDPFLLDVFIGASERYIALNGLLILMPSTPAFGGTTRTNGLRFGGRNAGETFPGRILSVGRFDGEAAEWWTPDAHNADVQATGIPFLFDPGGGPIAPRGTPSLQQLRTWVRRQLRDPVTNADGTPRPQSDLGWQDAEVNDAINASLLELQTHLASRGADDYVRQTELDVVNGEADLPADLAGVTIEQIEAEVQGRYITILRGHLMHLEEEAALERPQFYRWSLRASTLVGATGLPRPRLVIYPPLSGTVRVRYWDPSVIPTGDSDRHSLGKLWGELVALLAARDLLATDDDATDQQQMRYAEKLEVFLQMTRRKSGRIKRIPR